MTQKTILLVEDNPITRKMVHFALEQQGFAVVDAADGASALRSFPSHRVSLVLQDLILPDIDGFDLVQQLRVLPRGSEVPILAVSGLLSQEEEAHLAAAGFDDVITKPVEPSRLLQIVRAHLPARGGAEESFGEGRRLIVADDDQVQRKLMRFHFSRVGFEVTDAGDGAEAFELARKVKPAAIVSDVLMPELDGFGLCVAVRRDPEIGRTPLVLVTNSYVEAEDRQLARRAGAYDLVLRTPDMRAVIASLREGLGGAAPAEVQPLERGPDVERDRIERVAKQLERQVTLNMRVARRCSYLTAELSVLSSISSALTREDDVANVLDDVLVACLDAGGISVGALYLDHEDGARVVSLGVPGEWSVAEARKQLSPLGLLGDNPAAALTLSSAGAGSVPGAAELLARLGAGSAVVAPLPFRGVSLGVLITAWPVPDPPSEDRVFFSEAVAGQIGQALALARSFVAKAASERAARTQATVLGSILESMADVLVVADADGTVTHWNAAAESILGARPEGADPAGWARRYGLVCADEGAPLPGDQLPLVRAIRGESVDDRVLLRRGAGERPDVWLSVSARPVRDDRGELHGGLMVMRDITQARAAQTQLMVSDRMASIGMLAAGVAHEINNPLTAVVANLELAARGLEQLSSGSGLVATVAEDVDGARVAADRVRKIVRDLKVFSRMEEDRRGAVDVASLLDSSIGMAWNEIRHRAQMVKDYSDVPLVDANESRLGQVFLNLIVNAAQAIPEGQADRQRIVVATRRDGEGRVVVDITDTGDGIPPEVLPRLFTPFYTTKPVGVGTGLGLTICHRLITEIGGDITVDSEVGKGTTFHVSLPVMKGEAPAARVPDAVQAAPRRGRVLVIDDEVSIADVIVRVLEGEHDVVSANSAADALALIAESDDFDVVLCDLMMPVLTGMEFYDRLSEASPRLRDKVVFLTGGAFTVGAREFLDRVGNARLDKPFSMATLRTLVNQRIT